ncbi:MAG: LysM peptidoglycan-binding domain-containing protein [Spirochaetaceae bacterium]|nr:LysM peptidoglycan-binding domain-containing protein [Spirochaetaceae bacterium]
MGKNIGIKLADGSFYPIMEDGVPKRKLLELTTVQDNQTTVSIDLYRSSDDTMDTAEYVDTMKISGLVPHQGGEPNINLSLQLDENNVLSAEMTDAESGSTSNTSVDMVSLPVEQRQVLPDFTLSEVSDITNHDEAAFADDAFPAEFPDTIPAEQVEEQLASEVISDDSLLSEPVEDNSMKQETGFEDLDSIPASNTNEEDLLEDQITDSLDDSIMDEVPVSDPEAELGLEEPSFEDSTLDSEDSDTDLKDLPDFSDIDSTPSDDSVAFVSDSLSDEPSFQDSTLDTEGSDTDLKDLPDFSDIDSIPSDDSVAFASDSLSDEPSFEDSTLDSEGSDTDLKDLPDFSDIDSTPSDDSVAFASDSLSDEPSFQDSTLDSESSDTDLKDLPDFSDIDSTPSDDSVAFASDSLSDEPSFQDSTLDSEGSDTDLNDLPDFSDDNFKEENGFSGEYSLEDSSVYESSLPDFNKFELPDFDDPVQNVGFNSSYDSGLFNESDFDDPAFQEQPINSSGGAIDFSGLYDEPQEDIYPPEKEKKHRNTGAVITCVVCAIICLASLLFILFFLPSQINIDVSRKTPKEKDVNLEVQENIVSPAPEAIEELPPQPEPKEDVIVVAETPAVVPVPPPEPEKKPEPVKYKIKWGDTLWDLADSYYNNPWFYKKIAEANGISNPDYIISGTYITIPPK